MKKTKVFVLICLSIFLAGTFFLGGKVAFADPVITPDDTKAGVKLSDPINGVRYKDYSIPINRALVGELYEAVIGCSTTNSASWFIDEVAPGHRWDLKLKSSWNMIIGANTYPGSFDTKIVYNGAVMTPEELGNYTYGFIGRAVGFSLSQLNLGSWVAAGGPFTGPQLSNEYDDQIQIKRGFDAKQNMNLVRYNYLANGGTSTTGGLTVLNNGDKVSLTPTASKSGWTFIGWNTNKDAKTALTSLTMGTSDILLYAIFVQQTTSKYNVNLHPNGGLWPSSYNNNFSVNAGSSITLTTTAPTRTGYTFQGWATTSTGAVAYQKGATFKPTGSMVLYAVWKATTYKVTYNANGGSGAPAAQTKTYGKTLTLTTSKPTRTGYAFQGWAKTSTGAVAYASGASYTANAAITLYAVWKTATYKVTYNANGGSGAPAAQTKTYGKTLTLSTLKPTRTGYTFQGWAKTSTGAVAYKPGASYTANAAITLYAVWKANTYTVTFKPNGGTGGPTTQTKTYGKTLTLSTSKPTRTGYTFQGWSKTSTGAVAYASGASYTANAAITLYAVWKTSTYTVSYNANGGSGAPAAQSKTYGKTLTLSSTKPTRSGYTFQGWATSATGAVVYAAGGSYTANAAVTLYAVWKANATTTYTVTYNANGGSGAPALQTKTSGVTLTLSSTKPTRSGYTFQGWATSATGAVVYQPGAPYTANASVTLYAVWAAVSTTTITGLTATRGADDSQVILKWNAFSGTNFYQVYFKQGDGLKEGWDSNYLGTTTFTSKNNDTKQKTYTFTVYAYNSSGKELAKASIVYTMPGTTYTVTCSPNGGVWPSSFNMNLTCKAGSSVTIFSSLPTRTGYSFLGWSTSSTSTTADAALAPGKSYTPAKTMTIYAVWKANTTTTYAVTYNANGGSGAPSAQTKTSGVTLTLSSVKPSRANYTFQGWATSATGAVVYQPGNSYTSNAAVTLYAVWKVITYTVTCSPNGGVWPSSFVYTLTCNAGSSVTLFTTVPTRSGYKFQGWSTSSTSIAASYAAGSTFKPTANTTLYAVWSRN